MLKFRALFFRSLNVNWNAVFLSEVGFFVRDATLQLDACTLNIKNKQQSNK